jgi:hypothetical protein
MLKWIKSLFASSKNTTLLLTKEMMVKTKAAKNKAKKKTAKRGRPRKSK